MRIAITGGTGFVGRSLVQRLAQAGYQLNCWRRTSSSTTAIEPYADSIRWIEGQLGNARETVQELITDCDALVHAAFWRPGKGFRGTEGDLVEFARVNILGSLELMKAAVAANLKRFVFVSTCAVHEVILDDRELDEAHPLWPLTHYGAHKAAIEKFVHSYGLGAGFPICAIRPTGIYGVAQPVEDSKWAELIRAVAAGEEIQVEGGGKEVHVEDVARGIQLLLETDEPVAGNAYACYDRYVSRFEVAKITQELTGSRGQIHGEPRQPKNEICTRRIRELGMQFGGEPLLRKTIEELVRAIGP